MSIGQRVIEFPLVRRKEGFMRQISLIKDKRKYLLVRERKRASINLAKRRERKLSLIKKEKAPH